MSATSRIEALFDDVFPGWRDVPPTRPKPEDCSPEQARRIIAWDLMQLVDGLKTLSTILAKSQAKDKKGTK